MLVYFRNGQYSAYGIVRKSKLTGLSFNDKSELDLPMEY